MTKAKSLIDVLVDDSFAACPVDIERYELCVLLALTRTGSKDPERFCVPALDDRLSELARTISARMFTASFRFSKSFDPKADHPSYRLDQARVMRAYDQDRKGVTVDRPDWTDVDVVYDDMLTLYLVRMCEIARAPQRLSLKDGGFSHDVES